MPRTTGRPTRKARSTTATPCRSEENAPGGLAFELLFRPAGGSKLERGLCFYDAVGGIFTDARTRWLVAPEAFGDHVRLISGIWLASARWRRPAAG